MYMRHMRLSTEKLNRNDMPIEMIVLIAGVVGFLTGIGATYLYFKTDIDISKNNQKCAEDKFDLYRDYVVNKDVRTINFIKEVEGSMSRLNQAVDKLQAWRTEPGKERRNDAK